MRGGEEKRERVAAEAEQDGLRLGVAEAAVELQHPGAIGSQHQPRIQGPDERRSPPCQLTRGGIEDGSHHLLDQIRRGVRRRANRAHSARVRPLVAIEQALVVPGRRKRKHGFSVTEGDDGDLAARQPLLDQEPRARLPELVDRRRRPGAVVGHDHALPGRQPVELHHAGALPARVFPSRGRVVEYRRARGQHAGGAHDVLCKGLGRFDARRRLDGTEAGNSPLGHPVGESLRQRSFRAHHDQVGRLGQRGVREGGLRGHAAGFAPDSRIAGDGDDLAVPSAPPQRPHQRVLPPSAPDHDHLGHLDAVIPRAELKPYLARLLRLFTKNGN